MDRPHPGLGLLVGQHPGAGDVLAELGGIGDGVIHGGHAALVDEVDDELHLVDALELLKPALPDERMEVAIGVLEATDKTDHGTGMALSLIHI